MPRMSERGKDQEMPKTGVLVQEKYLLLLVVDATKIF